MADLAENKSDILSPHQDGAAATPSGNVMNKVKAGDIWLKIYRPDVGSGNSGVDGLQKLRDWMSGNADDTFMNPISGDDSILPKLDLSKFDKGAMENKELDIFNFKNLIGSAAPAEEPVYSIEIAEPFKALSPLRYRKRGFLSL